MQVADVNFLQMDVLFLMYINYGFEKEENLNMPLQEEISSLENEQK